MRNAKMEFLAHILNTTSKVKAAVISNYEDFDYHKAKTAILKVDHSVEDFKNFLDKIDYYYNRNNINYGFQEIYGAIWYEDGTWSRREVCCNEGIKSECWRYNFVPEIPNQLKGE